jgi:hypothetical protein
MRQSGIVIAYPDTKQAICSQKAMETDAGAQCLIP